MLASWAVPKGVPLVAGERHLAVHVEDHPLEYADFEGEIPAGQYGAGTVEIWDRGTYELVEEKKDGGLTVRLHGSRLDGLWTLVPAGLDGDPRNWLLLRKDGERRVAGPTPRCSRRPPMHSRTGPGGRSSRSGTATARSPASRAARQRCGAETTTISRRAFRRSPARSARRSALRRPCSTARSAPSTSRDDRASGSCSKAPARSSSSPSTCSSATASRSSAAPTCERREILEQLLDASVAGVLLAPSFDDGAALEQAAREQGLEGVVAKQTGSTYQPGRRSPDWRKLKLKQRQELVIAGYTRGKGRRGSGIGALVLGVHDADGLRYAGNVGTGLTDRELDRLEASACRRCGDPRPRSPTCRRCRACGATT